VAECQLNVLLIRINIRAKARKNKYYGTITNEQMKTGNIIYYQVIAYLVNGEGI
jgi:hypothetical protein